MTSCPPGRPGTAQKGGTTMALEMEDALVALKNLVFQLVHGNREVALQVAGDPNGFMVGQGITDADLSGVDIRQIVGDVCADGNYPQLQGYANGGGAPLGPNGYTPPPPSAGPQS